MPRVSVSASLGNLWENWDVAEFELSGWEHMDLERNKNRIRYARTQLMGLSFLAAFGMQPMSARWKKRSWGITGAHGLS